MVSVVFIVRSPKDKEELDKLIEKVSIMVGLSSPSLEQELNIKESDKKVITRIFFFMIKFI